MGLTTITASTGLLVSVSTLRDHCRGTTADNALLKVYSRAAQEYAENRTERSIYLQKFRLTLPSFPGSGEITLPRSPGSTSSISSTGSGLTISYLQAGGSTWTVFGSSNYRFDTSQEPPRVVLKYGKSWPSATMETGDPIRVEFHAGYTSTGSTWVSNPPEGIRQAVLLIGAHWYENRESVVVGTITARVPMAAESLLWMERV